MKFSICNPCSQVFSSLAHLHLDSFSFCHYLEVQLFHDLSYELNVAQEEESKQKKTT